MADDILTSLSLTEEERKVYNTVKAKLEQHFVKKRNVIFEHAKFNSRVQQQGESVHSFIKSIHCLVEHCQYRNLRSEMVRDRIVVGLLDETLSMKLQLDSELTLEKATAAARQRESVCQQQEVVPSGLAATNVKAAVQSKMPSSKGKASQSQQQFPSVQNPYNQQQQLMCNRCGNVPFHPNHQCPAQDAKFHKYRKIGHF